MGYNNGDFIQNHNPQCLLFIQHAIHLTENHIEYMKAQRQTHLQEYCGHRLVLEILRNQLRLGAEEETLESRIIIGWLNVSHLHISRVWLKYNI